MVQFKSALAGIPVSRATQTSFHTLAPRDSLAHAPNAIATVISTRVLRPQTAIVMATLLNTAGAMSGTAVASTSGKGIVESEAINLVTIGAAMVGIVVWSTIAWYYGLPTSESHALVSGLAGAAVATAGPGALIADGWNKVLAGLDSFLRNPGVDEYNNC